MKHLWKFSILLLVATFSFFYVADTAQAAIGYVYKTNFVSGYTANGLVETFSVAGYPANCRITSSIGININVIGWTWWQCSLLNSSGQVIQYQSGSSRAIYGSYTTATLSFASVPSGTATYRAEGVHDFNHTGSNPSPWRPYNSATN